MILPQSQISIDRIKIGGITLSFDSILSALYSLGFLDVESDSEAAKTSEARFPAVAGFSRPFKHYCNLIGSCTSFKKDDKFIRIYALNLQSKGWNAARFEFGITPNKTGYAAYELYPSNLNPQALKALACFDSLITETFGKNYAYASFFKNGKVSICEWCVDFLNIPPDSFLIHRPGARKSAMYQGNDFHIVDPSIIDFDDPDDYDMAELALDHGITGPTALPKDPPGITGHRKTQYSGGRKSLIQAKSYCKKTHLRDTCRPNLYESYPYRTRIEQVCRKTGTHPTALADMKNPFDTSQVLDLAKAATIKDRQWTWFVKGAKAKGVAMALKSLKTDGLRARMRGHLVNCLADWFNPSLVWKGREKAVTAITPERLQLQ